MKTPKEIIEEIIASGDYRINGFRQNIKGIEERKAPYDVIKWIDVYIVRSVGMKDNRWQVVRDQDEAERICKSLRPRYFSHVDQIRILSDGTIDTCCCYYRSNWIAEEADG